MFVQIFVGCDWTTISETHIHFLFLCTRIRLISPEMEWFLGFRFHSTPLTGAYVYASWRFSWLLSLCSRFITKNMSPLTLLCNLCETTPGPFTPHTSTGAKEAVYLYDTALTRRPTLGIYKHFHVQSCLERRRSEKHTRHLHPMTTYKGWQLRHYKNHPSMGSTAYILAVTAWNVIVQHMETDFF